MFSIEFVENYFALFDFMESKFPVEFVDLAEFTLILEKKRSTPFFAPGLIL